jgi:hypothetical protein
VEATEAADARLGQNGPGVRVRHRVRRRPRCRHRWRFAISRFLVQFSRSTGVHDSSLFGVRVSEVRCIVFAVAPELPACLLEGIFVLRNYSLLWF